MSTALTTLQNTALPAHLQAAGSQYLALNDSALGGINSGGFPSISIKGSKFHILDKSADPPVQTIMAMFNGSPMPAPYLDAVVIAANPALSKKFYEGKFDPDAEDKSPTCSSEDGIRPDAHITNPVNAACATCPKNAWGSKINEANGKEGKACSDFKRLVIVPSDNLEFKAMALDVTPAAIKEYGAYVRTLSARNVPIIGVITRLTFDTTASFPKLQFDFQGFLAPEQFEVVKGRIDSDEVRAIISPKRPAAQPALPAPTMPQPTTHNLSAAVTAAAAAAVAGTPMTPVDLNAAQAASNVVHLHPAAPTMQPTAAGTVTFGVATPAPAAEAKKPRGRPRNPEPAQTPPVDAVTAAAAASVNASLGLPDINAVPEPFKGAIVASGGLGSVGGDAVYSAYLATVKATTAVNATPPAANAGVSFVTPPPGSTVAATGGDLNAALAQLLAKK